MRRLFAKPGWKLLSVVLAYLFWLAVVEEKQAIKQLEVPVRFDSLDPTLAIAHDRPSSVIVRVQGSEQAIKDLQPPDIEARVDLSGLGRGRQLVRMGADSPSIMSRKVGIKVLEVFPSAFEVRLEPRLAAEVPIKPVLSGRPADGYEIEEVQVSPNRVRIEGPEEAVRQCREARTREIVVEGRQQTFEQELWVDVVNSDVRFSSEPRARVTVVIRESTAERTFSEITIAAVDSPHEVRVTPRTVRVSLRGPARLLASLMREQIVAFLEVGALEPRAEDYAVPVQISFTRDALRERLRVEAIVPPTVAVHLGARKGERRAERGR